MQQTRVVPPGCPVGLGKLIAASSSHIAHVAQRSMVVYDAQTLQLVQLATAHGKQQTSIAWDPVGESSLITASADHEIVQWLAPSSATPWLDGKYAEPVTKFVTPEPVVQLDWNPRVPTMVGLLFKNGRIATLSALTKDQLLERIRSEKYTHASKASILRGSNFNASANNNAWTTQSQQPEALPEASTGSPKDALAGGVRFDHWPSLTFYEQPSGTLSTVIRFAPKPKISPDESLLGTQVVGPSLSSPEQDQAFSRLAIGCADGTVRILESPLPSSNGSDDPNTQLPCAPIVCRPPPSLLSELANAEVQPASGRRTGYSSAQADATASPRLSPRIAVADIRWNPYALSLTESGENPSVPDLLVQYACGRIAAFNSMTGELIVDFLKQNDAPVTSIAFLEDPEQASLLGSPRKSRVDLFVTASTAANYITLWSTALQFPLQLILIKDLSSSTQANKVNADARASSLVNGIQSLTAIPNSKGNYAFVSVCGAVGVFHLPSGIIRCHRMQQTAHSGSIFDLVIKPSDPSVFASCAWDGTIRIWNYHNAKCTSILAAPSGLTKAELEANAANGRSSQPRDVSSAATAHHRLVSTAFGPNAGAAKQITVTSSSGTATVYNPFNTAALKPPASALPDLSVCGLETMSLNSEQASPSSQAYYSIAWGPRGSGYEDILVAATAAGKIHVWDTKSLTLVRVFSLGVKRPILRLSWSHCDPTLIAAATGELNVVIFTLEGNLAQRLPHPQEVYAVDFHPTMPKLLATGSTGPAGGIVRVWDISKPATPVAELRGHAARIFSVKWSPLSKELLASAGDDCAIKVWNVTKSRCVASLVSQSDRLRVLQWNYEIPYLLLSAGWGDVIRLWDIRSPEEPVAVSVCHNQDVYALATHKERPFSYISASRDGSIREYTISSSTALLRALSAQSIVGAGIDPAALASSPEAVLDKHSIVVSLPGGGPGYAQHVRDVTLCGELSQKVVAEFMSESDPSSKDGEKKSSLESVHTHRTLHEFFGASPMISALWQLMKRSRENASGEQSTDGNTSADSILYRLDVRARLWEKASALIGAPIDKASSAAAEEPKTNDISAIVPAEILAARASPQQLEEAASCFLQLGHMMQYCEIQIALDRWAQALAIAPSVSPGYWKQLIRRYSKQLESSLGANSTIIENDPSLHAALGDVGSYVKLMSSSLRTIDRAIAVAIGEVSDAWPYNGLSIENRMSSALETPPEDVPEADEMEELSRKAAEHRERVNNDLNRTDNGITPRILKLVALQSQMFQRLGEPVLAACAMAAVDEIESAVRCLVEGDEIFLAYSIAITLGLPNSDSIYRAAARRCEALGLWEEALQCLQYLNAPKDEVSALVSRFNGSSSRRVTLYLKAGLQMPGSYAELGRQQLAASRTADVPAAPPVPVQPPTTKGRRMGGTNSSAVPASASTGSQDAIIASTEATTSDANAESLNTDVTAALVAAGLANLNPAQVVQSANTAPDAAWLNRVQRRANVLMTLVLGGNYYEAAHYGLECLRELLIRPYFRTDELDAYVNPLVSLPLHSMPLAIRTIVQAYIYYASALRAISRGRSLILPALFALAEERARQARSLRMNLSATDIKEITSADPTAGPLLQAVSLFDFPLAPATILFQAVAALSWMNPVLAYPYACSLAAAIGVPLAPGATGTASMSATNRIKSLVAAILKQLQNNPAVCKSAADGTLETIAASVGLALPAKWVSSIPPVQVPGLNAAANAAASSTASPLPPAQSTASGAATPGSRNTRPQQTKSHSGHQSALGSDQHHDSDSHDASQPDHLEPQPLAYPSSFPEAMRTSCPLHLLPLVVCPDFGAALTAYPSSAVFSDIQAGVEPRYSFYPAGCCFQADNANASFTPTISSLSGRVINAGDIHIFEDGQTIFSRSEALEWVDCCPVSPLATGLRVRI